MDKDPPQPLTRVAVRVHAALSRCMRSGPRFEALDRLDSQFAEISRLAKRFRLCRDRGWLAAQHRERDTLNRRLDDLEDSIRHLTSQLGRDPIDPPTLRTVLEDLREITDEFASMRYESGGACLVAVTEPIVLEDIALGQFELRISLNALARGEPLDALHAVALAPNPCAADDGITHPHVNKERVCLGDASAAFQAAMQTGRLADAFLIARAVLATYNSDSPYCKLDAWYGRPCTDCGHIADGDDLYWCEGCQQDFCDECFSSCAACGTSSCEGCMTGCRLCDERVCDDCLSQCSTCGTTLCSGCLADGLCQELTRRIKASKSADCTLQFDAEHDQLVINGGLVEHAIHTLPVEEFPVVEAQANGQVVRVGTEEFKTALKTASMGMSREPSRYAVDGILVESDDKGVRLVATDGRRMVIVELEQAETEFQGDFILPKPWIAAACRLVDPKQDETLALHVDPQSDGDGKPQPARIALVGSDWSMSGTAHEGFFATYRDVIPKSGKRFVVDRELLLATLDEVALATDLDSKGLRLDLTCEQIELSASSAAKGSAAGSVPVITTNASSRKIVTAFNPRFMREALRSLDCPRVVIDVQPNQRSKLDGTIIQKPGLIYPDDGPPIRWLIMPVNVGSPKK